NNISCIRNKDLLNVNTSSDICVFYNPIFNMTGATKILSGLTYTSDSVHIVDETDEEINLNFSFTGNLSSLSNDDLYFSYDLFKLNEGVFIKPPIFSSNQLSNPYYS